MITIPPVVAPLGTTTLINVSDQLFIVVANTPLKDIVEAPFVLPKFAPVMAIVLR